MKHYLTLLFIFALCGPICFGAFGAATAWDVRSATGLDTNGGGFDSGVGFPGTNESLGSGTAITITLTGTTTGTGSPAFSSTTHGPGNLVHIASGSGCTTGWFEIVSVSGATATFDHTMGASTNVCTGTIGGSLLTLAQANTNSVASNQIWIQGTFTLTSTLSVAQSVITFTGYTTAHGDAGNSPVATITTATNSTDLMSTSSGSPGTQTWQNILFTNTAGTPANGIVQLSNHGSQQVWVFVSCKFSGFTTAINSDDIGAHFDVEQIYLSNCIITASTTQPVIINGGNNSPGLIVLYIQGSTISANAGSINDRSQGGTLIVDRSLIVGSTSGAGINWLGDAIISNSTIASNFGDGIAIAGYSYAPVLISNTIFYGNGGYGINQNISQVILGNALASRVNAFGSNTSGAAHNWSNAPADLVLTANPFTNAGSGNYALNSTTGGGALLKGAGFPGTFQGGLSAGGLDVGAVQTACGGGAGACAFSMLRQAIKN